MIPSSNLEAKLQRAQTDDDNILTAMVHEVVMPGREGAKCQ